MRIVQFLKDILKRFYLGNVYKPLMIEPSKNIIVGIMSFHNGNMEIRGDQTVSIGNYCAFGKNVSIITSNHDYNYTSIQGTFYNYYFQSDHPGVLKTPPNKERTKGSVFIGNDVWIADNVTILSGVTIGDGACIGNHSIVTKDVDSYSIVAGIPAREIKKRYEKDKIEFLENLKWWNWNPERISENEELFMSDLNRISLSQIKEMIK